MIATSPAENFDARMPRHERRERLYIARENIAYWSPIIHSDAELITLIRRQVDYNEPNSSLPPFQTIGKAIQAYAKMMNV